MCKEMPVIQVNKVDPKRIIRKKRRAEEEERHKGSLTPPPKKKFSRIVPRTHFQRFCSRPPELASPGASGPSQISPIRERCVGKTY
jgi:hypothetical protein